MQFLSEPTGGSDLAGCVTRAERDGDVFRLNGSKIWSTGAYASDYAMCLARTNWDVPKHRGLTMFILKVHQPGIRIDRIRELNGSTEFCQEFFDDVLIPAADVIGEVDDGWSAALRLLYHERSAVGGASIYTSGRAAPGDDTRGDQALVSLSRSVGRSADPLVHQVVADFHVERTVHRHLSDRIAAGTASGVLPGPSGAILKLFHANLVIRQAQAGLEIAGDAAVAGADGLARQFGDTSLSRQGPSLGGGSNEMQRNIISERVLGMPREWAPDRDVPFREVRRNRMPGRPSHD